MQRKSYYLLYAPEGIDEKIVLCYLTSNESEADKNSAEFLKFCSEANCDYYFAVVSKESTEFLSKLAGSIWPDAAHPFCLLQQKNLAISDAERLIRSGHADDLQVPNVTRPYCALRMSGLYSDTEAKKIAEGESPSANPEKK